MDDKENTKLSPLTATGARTFHPKRENVAFGRWAMPVMAERMQDTNASYRRRALQSLTDYVYDSKRVASKEFENVVSKLKDLHTDSNDEVRLQVIECFAAIVATAAGRRVFLNHEFFKEALKLLDDEEESIRYSANIVLERFSILPYGTDALIEAGAIESLITRIPNESEKVLVVLLQALHRLCIVDPDKALQLDALQTLTPLLDKASLPVRAKVSTVIRALTIEDAGRNQVPQLCAPLIKMVSEEGDDIKSKALSAMMMIVNSTEGKMAALNNGVVETVLPLLGSINPDVRINATKVLTAIGETSKGKQLLLPNAREIYLLLDDTILDIRKAAEKLVAVMEFEP